MLCCNVVPTTLWPNVAGHICIYLDQWAVNEISIEKYVNINMLPLPLEKNFIAMSEEKIVIYLILLILLWKRW